MRRQISFAAALALALVVGSATAGEPAASADAGYEVWAIDQREAAGKLYSLDGAALTANPGASTPEVIGLAAAVSLLWLAQTGTSPTRAHMALFRQPPLSAILAYVSSGHVVYMNAATVSPF